MPVFTRFPCHYCRTCGRQVIHHIDPEGEQITEEQLRENIHEGFVHEGHELVWLDERAGPFVEGLMERLDRAIGPTAADGWKCPHEGKPSCIREFWTLGCDGPVCHRHPDHNPQTVERKRAAAVARAHGNYYMREAERLTQAGKQLTAGRSLILMRACDRIREDIESGKDVGQCLKPPTAPGP